MQFNSNLYNNTTQERKGIDNIFKFNLNTMNDDKSDIILSPYVFKGLSRLNRKLDYIPIIYSNSTEYKKGELAIRQKINQNYSDLSGGTSGINVTIDTVIITNVDYDDDSESMILKFRPVVILKNNNNMMNAGTVPGDDTIYFKDGKWYSQSNFAGKVNCDRLDKITIGESVYRNIIIDGKLYEKEGKFFYDNPQSVPFDIPNWCKSN